MDTALDILSIPAILALLPKTFNSNGDFTMDQLIHHALWALQFAFAFALIAVPPLLLFLTAQAVRSEIEQEKLHAPKE